MAKDQHCLVLAVFLVLLFTASESRVKLKLLSKDLCERLSLEALCYEQYLPQTERALEEITLLIDSVSDKLLESVEQVLTQVTSMSTRTESKSHHMFVSLKKKFHRRVDKIRFNVTQSWDKLLRVNRDFLSSKNNVTHQMVIKKATEVDDVYKKARLELDKTMEEFIAPLKGMVINGLDGLEAVIDSAIKKERKHNKEHPHHHNNKDGTNKTDHKELTREERMRQTIDDLLPNFLGLVTGKVAPKAETVKRPPPASKIQRESYLDDLCFTVAKIKGKVKILLSPDTVKTADRMDQARKNMYVMWAEAAHKMYKDNKHHHKRQKLKLDKIWSTDNALADSFVNLLETYH